MTSVSRAQGVSSEGRDHPPFLYGTAWKEDRTASLTRLAITAGFRGIDTANQRRHYLEAAVGEAVVEVGRSLAVPRSDLFLQTKFTFAAGQDHRLPYDRAADTATQVQQSFASSLEHLGTTYIDAYLLHGPSSRRGLTRTDWEAWRAMEALQTAGRARWIGVSNVSLEQLSGIYRDAAVKPAHVQNRCYATMGWDRGVRGFCSEHGITYQGFSLLTANPEVLRSPLVRRVSQRLGRSPEQIVFRFALQIGILPLTGTSRSRHMDEDLACLAFGLEADEISALEGLQG